MADTAPADTPGHARALEVLRFIDEHHPKIMQKEGGSIVMFAAGHTDRIVPREVMRVVWKSGWIEESVGPGSGFYMPSATGYEALAAVPKAVSRR